MRTPKEYLCNYFCQYFHFIVIHSSLYYSNLQIKRRAIPSKAEATPNEEEGEDEGVEDEDNDLDDISDDPAAIRAR